MNKVTITGKCASKVETRTTPGGRKIHTFELDHIHHVRLKDDGTYEVRATRWTICVYRDEIVEPSFGEDIAVVGSLSQDKESGKVTIMTRQRHFQESVLR